MKSFLRRISFIVELALTFLEKVQVGNNLLWEIKEDSKPLDFENIDFSNISMTKTIAIKCGYWQIRHKIWWQNLDQRFLIDLKVRI